MPDLLPWRASAISASTHMERRTQRSLAAVEHQTLTRLALTQSEGIVQTEKVKEIDRLTREAMSGHALLQKWRQTLAAGDPFVDDELKFFTDLARMGKGEVIADTIGTFCRESRRS